MENIEKEKTLEELINEELTLQIKILNSAFLTESDIKLLCESLVKTYAFKYNSEYLKYIPNVVFSHTNESVHAEYLYSFSNNNIEDIKDTNIIISLERLQKNINRPISFSDINILELFNSIGHELRHWKQNCLAYKFSTLDIETQQKFDGTIHHFMDDFTNKTKLSSKNYEKLADFLFPYYQDTLEDENITDLYFEIIEHGAYLNLAHERDARQGGMEFVDFLTNEYCKHPLLDDKQKVVYINNFKDIKKHFERTNNYENEVLKMFADFENAFNASKEEILELAKQYNNIFNIEFSQNLNDIDPLTYSRALKILIKDKTLEEKREMLKNAIFNGYSILANNLITSIVEDKDYQAYKEKIEEDIYKYLIKSSLNDSTLDYGLTSISYNMNYKKILSEKMLMEILEKLIQDDKIIFANTFFSQFSLNISNKSIKKLKTIILNKAKFCFEDYEKNPDKYSALFSEVNQFAQLISKLSTLEKNYKEKNKLNKLSLDFYELDEKLENIKYDKVSIKNYSLENENHDLLQIFKEKYGNRQIALNLSKYDILEDVFKDFVKDTFNIDFEEYKNKDKNQKEENNGEQKIEIEKEKTPEEELTL